MRRDVEGGLNGQLQRMFDEALLAHVVTQRVEMSEATQVRHRRHDRRQPLLDERPIGHGVAAARCSARLRYSVRIGSRSK